MTFFRSLSGRLLLLTALFVMLAEILIFVPSVARQRLVYFEDRMEAAKLVSFADEAMRKALSPDQISKDILMQARALSISIKRPGARELILAPDDPRPVSKHIDLRDFEDGRLSLFNVTHLKFLVHAIKCILFADDDAIILVMGDWKEGRIEITLSEAQVRKEMIDYGKRILALSLLISVITAALVYLSLHRFLVRPMRRIISSMANFRLNPEQAPIYSASNAQTEIGEAERELAAMQTELRAALKQKSRLAALGEAVAKINHDLRNILASAQLVGDRLEHSADPLVRRIAPKLVRAIDRAIALCRNTLEFGRADEPPPKIQRFALAGLMEETRDAAAPGGEAPQIVIDADADLTIDADPEQLFRILLNLTRNAVEAVDPQEGRVTLSARRETRGEAAGVHIEVADNGPGLPEIARENLFRAFRGRARKGGSGLGLAIAHELANGHGGALELAQNGPQGARFSLWLPDHAASIAAARSLMQAPRADALMVER